MKKDNIVFVAGGRGLVGSSIVRRLKEAGFVNIRAPSRAELDLTNESAVD